MMSLAGTRVGVWSRDSKRRSGGSSHRRCRTTECSTFDLPVAGRTVPKRIPSVVQIADEAKQGMGRVPSVSFQNRGTSNGFFGRVGRFANRRYVGSCVWDRFVFGRDAGNVERVCWQGGAVGQSPHPWVRTVVTVVYGNPVISSQLISAVSVPVLPEQ
jgi:hypothetical protein